MKEREHGPAPPAGNRPGPKSVAVAKMLLFEALDEIPNLASSQPELVVDASNIEELLSRLEDPIWCAAPESTTHRASNWYQFREVEVADLHSGRHHFK